MSERPGIGWSLRRFAKGIANRFLTTMKGPARKPVPEATVVERETGILAGLAALGIGKGERVVRVGRKRSRVYNPKGGGYTSTWSRDQGRMRNNAKAKRRAASTLASRMRRINREYAQ